MCKLTMNGLSTDDTTIAPKPPLATTKNNDNRDERSILLFLLK